MHQNVYEGMKGRIQVRWVVTRRLEAAGEMCSVCRWPYPGKIHFVFICNCSDRQTVSSLPSYLPSGCPNPFGWLSGFCPLLHSIEPLKRTTAL